MSKRAQIRGKLQLSMPWVVLGVGLAMTVVASQTMAIHERVEINWATHLAAQAIKTDLVEDMEWQRIGLDRLALLWPAKDSALQQLWNQNARLYIEHRPGCVAVEWLGNDGERSLVSGPRATPNLAFDGFPEASIKAARNSRTTVVGEAATLSDGSAQYTVTQPVFDERGAHVGSIVAFFDIARSIRSNLGDVTDLGFSFALLIPGQPEYVFPGVNRTHETDWGSTIEVPIPGKVWQLRVWPNPDAYNSIKSALPQVTLALGGVLSIFAALTFFFAMRVSFANKALQREIAVREGIENELRRARDELGARVYERTSELATANVLLQRAVSEHQRADKASRELTGRLFRMQDEERRRLARELHDGATQNIAALALDISRLRDAIPATDTSAQDLGNGCVRLARQSADELRTLSYLLHPPLLNELGLSSALQDFAEGFAARTGIKITTNIESDLGRFDEQLEVTVFRIAQEAFSNIHRHAHSLSAAITLTRHGDYLHLEVADEGRSIPPEVLAEKGAKLVGVGIAGMRERVRMQGGTLCIDTGNKGTRIQVLLPGSRQPTKKPVGKAEPESNRQSYAIGLHSFPGGGQEID